MAKMFPEKLGDDIASSAERLLYKAFQEQLSDDFTVFHSVSWQVPDLRSAARDGEADFVITCPNLGILVMEVKGGAIRYDGTAKEWYSNTHSIKDPFKQACDSRHRLLRLLKEQPYWNQRRILIGHAVAFPDIVVNGRLRPDAPREIILDSTQIKNLSDWVKTVLNYYLLQDKRQSILDAEDIKEIVRIFSPSIYLKPLLGIEIHKTKQESKRLSEQQFRVLDFLRQQQRAAISGCAGSGKTLLAVEKARRLNEQGFSVLLTCFNKNLAQFLRKNLRGTRGLQVYHFHGLCKKLASNAGIDPDSSNYSNNDLLWNKIYPELLFKAADQLNWRVDAVIVDEGQDFRENWWLPLQHLLNDPDQGTFYVFYDDNQNLYCPSWKPPFKQAPFTLTENWRNTKRIHSHALQFYKGKNTIVSLGAEGLDVEILDYPSNNNTQLQETIGSLLNRLVFDEGVSTNDIVILTTTRKQTLQNKVLGQFRVKADPDLSTQEILCNTIHQFKGLESPVVILVETELRSFERLRNWLYVGTSRARNHLIILQPDELF